MIGKETDNKIDVTKFSKIDNWHIDSYTGFINVLSFDGRIFNKIPEGTEIDGQLKKGSYIFVNKKCGNKVEIITAAEFKKLMQQKEVSVTR